MKLNKILLRNDSVCFQIARVNNYCIVCKAKRRLSNCYYLNIIIKILSIKNSQLIMN